VFPLTRKRKKIIGISSGVVEASTDSDDLEFMAGCWNERDSPPTSKLRLDHLTTTSTPTPKKTTTTTRTDTSKSKIEDFNHQQPVTLLRQRQRGNTSDGIGEALGLSLETDSISSDFDEKQNHTSHSESMGPPHDPQESASFLPTGNGRSGVSTRKTMGYLSRFTRQRKFIVALCITTFFGFQLWVWGPDLVGRERIDDWKMALDGEYGRLVRVWITTLE